MQYLLTVSYLGTDFCGFQTQPSVRTVQATLTGAFGACFSAPVDVRGCSRTDSGVHALCAAVTVRLPEGNIPIPAERLPLAVAPYLPPDLSVYRAQIVPDDFHVRHDVQKKEYVYRLYNTPVRDPFREGRAWQFPYPMPADALSRMERAARCFVGTHDFSAFMSSGSDALDTHKTVFSFLVKQADRDYTFTVVGDGFLYNMVRIMVGTLIDVAMHRLDPDSLPSIILSRDRARAGETAPPEGLYLSRVFYPAIEL
ncbi:MAG: tRNA pseudouridine(38-40) synthase TruA [Clostridia bacterium]|nr:tRNA pseudouridine(38-40) synthase TruA [Clostridia bacterium]